MDHCLVLRLHLQQHGLLVMDRSGREQYFYSYKDMEEKWKLQTELRLLTLKIDGAGEWGTQIYRQGSSYNTKVILTEYNRRAVTRVWVLQRC